MFRIEKMQPENFPFAVELANTMGWNMGEIDFAFNLKMDPDGCFILKQNSRAVGIATCINYGKVGWFGNLIIQEGYRRRGAGTLLVNHAVKHLRNAGVATVGIYAYPHLIKFYGDIGFQPNAEFIVLKAKTISPQRSEGNNDNIKPLTTQQIVQAIKLDAGCFGAKREKLLEPILKNKNNCCFVVEERKGILGFAAAKVYDEMAEIGPLVCRGNFESIAETLLLNVFTRLSGLETYACLPSSATRLVDAASRAGFKEEFKMTRMFLGSPVQKDCIYLPESLERG